MIVCDNCKDIKAPAKMMQVITQIPHTKKGKTSNRKMIQIEVAVCEKCIDKIHSSLGYWFKSIVEGTNENLRDA